MGILHPPASRIIWSLSEIKYHSQKNFAAYRHYSHEYSNLRVMLASNTILQQIQFQNCLRLQRLDCWHSKKGRAGNKTKSIPSQRCPCNSWGVKHLDYWRHAATR